MYEVGQAVTVASLLPLRAVGVLFSPMLSGWVSGRRKTFVRDVSHKLYGLGSGYLVGTLVGGVGVQRRGVTLI